MKYYDQALKGYAKSGLRTAADWESLGRKLKPDSKPCAETTHRGEVLSLFTRNQTEAVSRR
jgi:hypothetical protein